MQGAVRQHAWEVNQRLAQLGLTKEKLVSIVKACVAGHGGCTDNDPPNARGFESWRWGVRRAREELRPEGWEKDDTGNFSTVVNHDLKVRLAVMNADDGAGLLDRVPQNRAKKGPNSERVAATNRELQLILPGLEQYMDPTGDQEGTKFSDYSTWHLCVHINGDTVRAELTLLADFSGGFFTGFVEKIIVLGDGEWQKSAFQDDSPDDEPELDIEVVRK